jgi:hypothetical protein
MGSVYPKRGKLYVKIKRDGRWIALATGLSLGQEPEARALLEQLEQAIQVDQAFDAHPP